MTELNTASDFADVLTECINDGLVYNVDFEFWKSKATRLLEKAVKQVTEVHHYAVDFDSRSKADNELNYDLVGVSVMTFPSKKIVKKVSEMDTAFSRGIAQVIAEWQPVGDLFKQAKPLIVKGRKPSDTPRQTPERTLENTGTCGCCGQNVKMRHGHLVDHGFNIRHGFRNGQCPGVGFEPIEVSPAILHHMVKIDEITENSLSGILTMYEEDIRHTLPVPSMKALRRNNPKDGGQVHSDEQGYGIARKNFLDLTGTKLRMVQAELTRTKKRIAKWEPKTLPGDLIKTAANDA